MSLQDFLAIRLVANGLLDGTANIFPLGSHGLCALQRITNLAIRRNLEPGVAIRNQSILTKRQVGLDRLGTLFQVADNFIALAFGWGGLNFDVPELSQAFLSSIP
ncbi:hypothetical protein ACKZDW_16680 [Ralstonia syzygii subsp. celebesensis]|uniref:hypothetical protein n=1 Tax=Ralstonia syzygii TaxID=28097 RepID=UPI0015618A80|nr:hypothetical protein [Ralstonia syzygii]